MKSSVITRDGREQITAYRYDDPKYPRLVFRSLQRKHKYTDWATDYMCLDTETSHLNDDVGWVYQWAIKFKDVYIYGRKPSQIIDYLSDVAEHYELGKDKRIIVYVHNLQYDYQYIKRYLMRYDPQMSVLAIDNHTVLTVDVFGFRFICSYKLTNLSLAVLSESYAKKYLKAVGEIDYTIVRYQDTKLKDVDWEYMFSDVASQYDGIREYLSMNGYNFCADAPFTSTGFVRAACRKASKLDEKWREEFERSALSLEQYRLCRQAFMGGKTLCSFLHSGELISGVDLGHDDFCSSYPARQMLDYMPIGQPMTYGDIDSMDEFNHVINKYCCVFVLHLENVHLKDGVTAPYIPSSKCIHKENDLRVNGAIVYAKSLSIAITELDYKWIKAQYNADHMKVTDMLCFSRGTMPQWLKDEIMQYFTNKCTLKHSDPILYAKSKNLLNGIYGMTATAIIREVYALAKDTGIISLKDIADPDAHDEKALKKYYKSYNSFMEYQHALFTTAHARDALMTMIADVVGYENFLYCDTDSVFYIKTPETVERMKQYYEYCKQRAIDAGAYVGDKYLGAPEAEPPITAFKGLHAKCYAMIEEGELKVTIAGIPKKSTKWINGEPVTKSNSEELGHIDNLEDGFVFEHCGGTRCIYVECDPTVETINGHRTEHAGAAIIENIEKKISDTMWTVGANYELLKIKQEST